MSFGHEMRQTLGQSLEQALEQKIEQRIEIIQRLGLHLSQILQATEASPANYWTGLIRFLALRIKDTKLRSGFESLLTNPFLMDRLLVSAEDSLNRLLTPNHGVLMEISIDAMFKMKQAPGEEPIETNIVQVLSAFKNPQEAQEEIERLEELMRSMHGRGEDTTGLMQQHREYRNAQDVQQELRPLVDNITSLLMFAYRMANETNESYLRNYFRDMLIVHKLRFIASDRIVARFAGRFINIAGDSKPREHAAAVINTVFEYMLVAIGIISPNLFILNWSKSEVDEEVLDPINVELQSVAKKWNLNLNETFFWNRWAIINQKPSAITDNKIRDMVRLFQEEDGPKILEAIEFDQLFEDVLEILDQFRSGESTRNDTKDTLRSRIADVLTGNAVEDLLIQLLQTKWYARLTQMGFQRRNPAGYCQC